MSKNLNISVLVAARDEYIEQLKSIICPLIIQGVNSIYQDAVKVSEGKKIIWTFQQFLKDILTWNQTILQEEAKRIKRKCPYIMDIVTAIFVSNVKILASIRLKGNNDNIKVKIPTCEIFIHSVYIECAQQIFYDPKLFYHKNGDMNQIQRNKKYVREIIYSAIDESMRKMMPFDHILQEYLKNALDDNAEYTDSESEPDSDPEEDTLVNDKVIDEPDDEEPSPPGEDTTKNLHINGLSSFQIPNQTPIEPYNPTPPPPPQSPIPFEDNYSDSDSDSYSGSSSSSGSSSGSSRSSGSSGSSGSSRSSGSSGSEKPKENQINQGSHEKHVSHGSHGSHGKHGKHGKHKYSFF
jgi:uncharacterized membrane protein YgcG